MGRKDASDSVVVTRVIERADQAATLQVRRARLKVIKGPDKGAECDLQSFGVVAGTSDECDLVLTDESVSRRHFELVPCEKGFRLRDLGSMNGTLLYDLQITSAVLNKTLEIHVGKTTIRFTLLDEHDEYPLSERTSLGPLLGRSLAMRQVFATLERTADSDSTLMVEGESGTGKDLVAETVHGISPRRDGPFVVVDCGAMKPSLVESELFGHRKGAFTGADKEHAGAFESADGGTVFLDEIGELDKGLQPKLLRLLEQREVKRLGETRYRPVNVRLIAATNRDLTAEVKAERFRQDLFYRISVVRMRLPPLRERQDDIAMLARSFVGKLNPDADPEEVINQQVLALFKNHDWPGNVRELRNVVERLLLFPERPESAIQQAGIETAQGEGLMNLPFHEARGRWVDRFEQAYLQTLLAASDGVVARAARAAGIPRQTFHRLMTKHGLTK
jgi:transcriptional regulator with GAF, ATPase, and Fis domain